MSKKSVKGTVVGAALGTIGGVFLTKGKMGKETARQKELANKHLELFVMMCDWMRTKQEGKSLLNYLEDKGYKSVAIYGMSFAGERLLDELRDGGVEVKYAVDKKADPIYFDTQICRPEENLEEVDVMIVTAITFYDEIRVRLKEKLQCPILSLEDIIHDL